ncbi:MAG: methyltransferase domain-containing protein [Chloroflexi bacterium]|nr:methyltransferase domain-containing protein [Chloroflexota bacterium]
MNCGKKSRRNTPIASRLAGPTGRVVGFDMTEEMLKKAQAGAAAMGAANVEFREGLAEAIPLPDNFADVVISNGVLNLTLDKTETLREWFRILKPGGRLQVGDILVEREVPSDAMDDISLPRPVFDAATLTTARCHPTVPSSLDTPDRRVG